MDDQTKTQIVFGVTREERIRALYTVAEEIRAGEHVPALDWRNRFVQKAGERCGFPLAERYKIYNFLSTIGLDDLNKLRIFCIGEEAEAALQARRYSRIRASQSKNRVTSGLGNQPENGQPIEADITRFVRVRGAFEAALIQLSEVDRTRTNLAKAMAKPQYVIDGYLYQNPAFAEKLIDGMDVFQKAFFQCKK